MIKSDWDTFKAKFNQNPQKNFEWFCYLLFCIEFNKRLGIFAYFNQRNIETIPIQVNDEIISWQAKFYTTPVSDHTSEIIKLIEGAKKDFPSLTKIIFYCNQNWGQGKDNNDSISKKKIDDRAKELGVAMDWEHMGSFFDSPFIAIDNEQVSKFFFTYQNSLHDIIASLHSHSVSILKEISTNIIFNNKTLEIDRTDIVEKMSNEKSKVTILSGNGGVGKTAIIKKLFEKFDEKIPFYIFKATEFELNRIDDLFTNFTFIDFIKAFEKFEPKVIVIDSAEKLLDLKNSDPFKQILITLIDNNWKIIFTTRNNYLEDLILHFLTIYHIIPVSVHINDLNLKELSLFSKEFNFNLPDDSKLLELIKNPFYLNEYLKSYSGNEQIDLENFKKRLWNQKIFKSKPGREICFLQTAKKRATEGQFIVNPDCESEILDEFTLEGILGYEQGGFFITHDIYEEWALEKIIQIEFDKNSKPKDFFENIGINLAVRRSFRNWLSYKLSLSDKRVHDFILEVINDIAIAKFWKDEILISVLLSDYSESFFKISKDKLLENNFELLRELVFLLRIACKEIDVSLLKLFGVYNVDKLSINYLMTIPKGKGWEVLIKFFYDNLEAIGVKYVGFITKLLYEWNSQHKFGQTTKYASLLALKYYQYLIENDFSVHNEGKRANQLFTTILYGAHEIKDELTKLLDEILVNKWKHHNDPYNDFSETILSKMEGITAVKALPENVIKLANLFWTYSPPKDKYSSRRDYDIEQHFNIEDNKYDYIPTSAYQSPIYWLLNVDFQLTFKFIVEFTNKCIENYAKSRLAENEISEIEVHISEDKTVKQYFSGRLWGMYRGSQAAPSVLVCLHMALEKFLLEQAKIIDSAELEKMLMYLLENSNSASITSVIASVVMAFPDKTFNIAKIIFQTQEFIYIDTSRRTHDSPEINSLYDALMPIPKRTATEIFDNERKESDELPHRQLALENIMRDYQIYKPENISDEEFENRKKQLGDILEKYYKQLPKEEDQTEWDKIWRLYLARMDFKNMEVTTEKVDSGYRVTLSPKIEPDLKKISDDSQKSIQEQNKYSALKSWCDYKYKGDERSKQYSQYEENPNQVVSEVKMVINDLHFTDSKRNNPMVSLIYSSLPIEACYILIRDHFDNLTSENQEYCVNTILESSNSITISPAPNKFNERIDVIFGALPLIFDKFPQHRKKIQLTLLYGLFNEHSIGWLNDEKINIYSIMSIQKLWKNYPDFAKSILIGFIILRKSYDEIYSRIRRRNSVNNVYNIDHEEVINVFFKENEKLIETISENNIAFNSIGNLSTIDISLLDTAFRLLPNNLDNEDNRSLALEIINIFADRLFCFDKSDRIDYSERINFLEKFSKIVLTSSEENIRIYLKPILEKFGGYEAASDLFVQLIGVELKLGTGKLWFVWELFKEKIIKLCEQGDGYAYIDKIIKSYLFDSLINKNDTDKDKQDLSLLIPDSNLFFKEMSEKIGNCPSTLFAISKLIYDFGFYLEEGISWISKLISRNDNNVIDKIDSDTIYYIENNLRKYVYLFRTNIKKSRKLKDEVLVICDFLISKDSVIGYILRENII